MKRAIILSAGQGRRLLPLTAEKPKCALQIQGRALIEWQLDALEKCGVEQVTVVTGFGAEMVEDVLARRRGTATTNACFNPFFEVSDNLISCWVARTEMTSDFVLLNGDTLFEPAVLERLMGSPPRPVTLAIDEKQTYDADDMKVRLAAGGRLVQVGKDLAPGQTHGESIGMILFRAQGLELFRTALERAVRDPAALKQWFLSVIGRVAVSKQVWTQSISGLDWCEVDYPLDLLRASAMIGRRCRPHDSARVAEKRADVVVLG